MAAVTDIQKKEVIDGFRFRGKLLESKPFGGGHINDTFLLTFEGEDGNPFKIVLQRMNHHVFKKPVELMENVMNVTSFLRQYARDHGGDPDRETLHFIKSKEGAPYYKDSFGDYWRAYVFIADASSLTSVRNTEDFYQSAVAFGEFQKKLASFPAEKLHETIPDFHNTRERFKTFTETVAADPMGRAAGVAEEIAFVKEREDLACFFQDLLDKGELPLRVTHNDTKLDNILFDDATGKAICVIDLDTVMPGLAVFDFGDSIRFGANPAREDEKDLTKVYCDLELFEAYVKGFLAGVDGKLTKREIDLLPMGAKEMTYECGMRFLADYIDGDHYFKIDYPEQNLDRARTQFKLVKDMEDKWEQMLSIVEREADHG